MYRALPGSDYYEGSAPSRCHQPTTGLPTRASGIGQHRTVPTFTTDRSAGSATSFSPDSLATSTPQAFLVASRSARLTGRRSRVLPARSVRALPARPISARFEPRTGLEGVPPLVHCALHLSALLAEPGPSGSTDPSRRCRGCSRPHPRLRGQAAPSFKQPAATGRPVGPFIPPDQIAPRGAPPASSTRWSPPSPPASPRGPSANRAAPAAPPTIVENSRTSERRWPSSPRTRTHAVTCALWTSSAAGRSTITSISDLPVSINSDRRPPGTSETDESEERAQSNSPGIRGRPPRQASYWLTSTIERAAFGRRRPGSFTIFTRPGSPPRRGQLKGRWKCAAGASPNDT